MGGIKTKLVAKARALAIAKAKAVPKLPKQNLDYIALTLPEDDPRSRRPVVNHGEPTTTRRTRVAQLEGTATKLKSPPVGVATFQMGFGATSILSKVISQQRLKPPVANSFRPRVKSASTPRTHRERRRARSQRASRNYDYYGDGSYGTIDTLTTLMSRDVTLFAIDCEFINNTRVSEIGISTLRTRDIANTDPGPGAQAWFAKAKHHHMVITNYPEYTFRMHRSLFATSQLVASSGIREALLQVIRSCVDETGNAHIALVGHSLINDIDVIINDPSLKVDLRNTGISNITVDAKFDTHMLSLMAEREGAGFASHALGPLARTIGVSKQYHSERGTLVGTHNSSNDAAYTLMALLLFCSRWKTILKTCRTYQQGQRPSLTGEEMLIDKQRLDQIRKARNIGVARLTLLQRLKNYVSGKIHPRARIRLRN